MQTRRLMPEDGLTFPNEQRVFVEECGLCFPSVECARAAHT